MDVLIKASIVGVVGAVLALLVKKNNPETAVIVTLAAAGTVIFISAGAISGAIDFMRELASSSGISPTALAPVIKTMGIGIIGRVASDTCRDAGQASTASAVELAASACAIFAVMPLMKSVFQMIRSLI